MGVATLREDTEAEALAAEEREEGPRPRTRSLVVEGEINLSKSHSKYVLNCC